MIREAHESDVPELVGLAAAFHAASTYAKLTTFDPETATKWFTWLVGQDVAGVWVIERGMGVVGVAAALIHPLMFSPEKQAQELLWYVHPEHRDSRESLRLFAALEGWAMAHGATVMCMGALTTSPPAVHDLYRRRGYEMQETGYIKRLAHVR